MSVRKGGGQLKKGSSFSSPNKTNPLCFFLGIEATWTNEKEEKFSAPNKTKSASQSSCDALNAPQSQSAALNARNRVH